MGLEYMFARTGDSREAANVEHHSYVRNDYVVKDYKKNTNLHKKIGKETISFVAWQINNRASSFLTPIALPSLLISQLQ